MVFCYYLLLIEQDLKVLGLTDNEVMVYLAVVQHGKLTPSALAKLTKIKRTTIYNVVKTLSDKQLVVQDLGSKAAYISARPIEELPGLISQEQRIIERKKRAVSELLPELQQLVNSSTYSLPRITFTDEEHLEQHLYKAAGVWNQSMLERDSVWWGFQDPSFVTHYKDWIDWYWKKSAPVSIILKLLSSESAIEKEMAKKKYDRRHIKFWNKTGLFTGTIWVTGDFITLIMTRQRPHYLVEIHDQILAQNLRALFKGIWDES